MKTIIEIAFFLLLLTGIHAQAQVQLTTKAPETVTIEETFTIRYTLNADAKGAETSLSKANGLEILFGPDISMALSTKNINGKETIESSATFTYILQAKKSGEINIPRLTIKTANNSYQSEALQIQVIGGEKAQHTKPVNTPVSTSGRTREDLFIRIEPTHQSVYVNVGLPVTIKLYTQRDITGFGKMTFPSFDGFVVEGIELPTQNMAQEQYKGKKYYTVTLAQYLLSPKEAGTIEVTSGKYEIVVLKKQKGSKSDDFFGREKHLSDTLRVGNLPVSITALPNPEDSTDNSIISVIDYLDTPSSPSSSEKEEGNIEIKEEASDRNIQIYLSETNHKILFHIALVLLILLIIIYTIKARSQNGREYTRQEQGYEVKTKSSLDWHLPYIIGILLLICCLVVLWK